MKLGLYNAILHDRSLSEAIAVIAGLGLTGIEINTGGFLPPVHVPTFDDILVSDTARDDYLGIFEGTGVSIAGLNCNGNPLHPNPAFGPKHAADVHRSIQLTFIRGCGVRVHLRAMVGGRGFRWNGRVRSGPAPRGPALPQVVRRHRRWPPNRWPG